MARFWFRFQACQKAAVREDPGRFRVANLLVKAGQPPRWLVGAVLCAPAGFPAIVLRVLLAFHAACLPTEIVVFGAVASIIRESRFQLYEM